MLLTSSVSPRLRRLPHLLMYDPGPDTTLLLLLLPPPVLIGAMAAALLLPRRRKLPLAVVKVYSGGAPGEVEVTTVAT